jgi:DNA-binding response OmpR family regulator
VNTQPPAILIVEDDLDVAEMLNAFFVNQDYRVITVNWGEDGVRACQDDPPDVLILDIRLPDIDGFEVARRLRSQHRTRSLPVIFLTEKRDRVAKLTGLSMAADDYITKPFDMQELGLRVRNTLERNKRINQNHPVTGLPDSPATRLELINDRERNDLAIFAISLSNLEPFREAYGFVALDDMVRAVSIILKTIISELGNPEDYLGHLSGQAFMIVTSPDRMDRMRELAAKRLEQSIDFFYKDQDLKSNRFQGKRIGVITWSWKPGGKSMPDLHTLQQELSLPVLE